MAELKQASFYSSGLSKWFLSKEETRTYLLAADAMERERLIQQFAFKYLLRASGGSNDQNREWEVGNGYDDDNGRGLKR